MLLEHRGETPDIHESAYIAPTATICGDVRIGANSRVLFGATVAAEGGPVDIGENCIIMENAVLRGTGPHPLRIGEHVLVGPRAYLTGCTVKENVFLATGITIFNGAELGAGTEVRINGVVHIMTVLPPESLVPIGWVAVGDPAEMFSPDEHEAIWEIQKPLNFPEVVFGLERAPPDTLMPQLTRRYSQALEAHHDDTEL